MLDIYNFSDNFGIYLIGMTGMSRCSDRIGIWMFGMTDRRMYPDSFRNNLYNRNYLHFLHILLMRR